MSDIFDLLRLDDRLPKIEAPIDLLKIISSFKNNYGDIKEFQVESSIRVDYINPLLEMLGWDVANRLGLSPSKRDVIYEPRQMIDGTSLAPDYSLCLDGNRKVYVEAKRVSENIYKNKNHAYQLRKYSWNAGLPFGILTDFEELAIYDCRFPPAVEDSSEVARIGYLTYKEFADNWSQIHYLFSKKSIEEGSLEKIALNEKIKKGTQTIDSSFLKFMKTWRKIISQNIANLNVEFDETLIDYETQTFLNKIIFLRILEDRGLEPRNSLMNLLEIKDKLIDNMEAYFRKANNRYNSGLFSGSGMGSRYLQDKNEKLRINNEIIEEFIKSLYYPNPFEFSVMPADILGKIYEIMLSEDVKIIDNKSREIEVNLKPEVKKKGGVFYTPSPIVQYIIEETIGPLIEGKTPAEIQKIKILDPASGSGSFLVATYQYLIDYCTDYYAQNKKFKKLEIGANGNYKLSLDDRRKLLENCIFGVDIDAQAVEVSKLSLLLKMVENETQFQLDIGHLLPNIDKNLCCGNSLIDIDFQQTLSENEFDSDFNPFNWKTAFPDIFTNGGFDAVIGNPPYLNVDAMWGTKDPRLSYLKAHYSNIYQDKTDLLYYFLEKSVSICKGEIGMIVSRSFVEADKAQKLRSWLVTNSRVREILDFRNAIIFKGVGINTLIINLTKSKAVSNTKIKKWKSSSMPEAYQARNLRDKENYDYIEIPVESLGADIWNFGDNSVQKLLGKIDSSGEPLANFAIVGQGMQTGLNNAFEISEAQYELIKDISPKIAFPRVTNSNIKSFGFSQIKKFILYLEDLSSFNQIDSEIVVHLKNSQKELKNRAAFKRGDCDWYKYTFPLHKELFISPKIISPYMAKKCTFAVDDENYAVYLTDTTIIYIPNSEIPYYALCAILNSEIIDFRFNYMTKLKGGGQKEFFAKQVEKIPIPFSDLEDPRILKLDLLGREVSSLLKIQNSTQLIGEKNEIEKQIIQNKHDIENIVTTLFNLSLQETQLIQKLMATDLKE